MPPHHCHDNPDLATGCRAAHVVGNAGVPVRASANKVGPADSLIEGNGEDLDRCLSADMDHGCRVVTGSGVAHVSNAGERLSRSRKGRGV